MTAKRTKKKAPVETARVGKDEMNLAEFPITILTHRAPEGVKTLRYQDQHGQLTVTGSDALGLPTAIDADVIVALIELTKKRNNFTEQTVNFTRYELIRLMGWANVGTSYDRVEESLNRWAGVLLMYDGCWWNNQSKTYVSKTFGSSVFKCKTSQIGPSGPWPSGGCARSSSRSLATPDSSPGSIGPTDSSLTSVHRYAW